MPWAREFASFHSGNSTPRVSFRLWLDRTEMHTVSPWTRRLKGFQVECSGRWFDCLPLLMPNELNKPKERGKPYITTGNKERAQHFCTFQELHQETIWKESVNGITNWLPNTRGRKTNHFARRGKWGGPAEAPDHPWLLLATEDGGGWGD